MIKVIYDWVQELLINTKQSENWDRKTVTTKKKEK